MSLKIDRCLTVLRVIDRIGDKAVLNIETDICTNKVRVQRSKRRLLTKEEALRIARYWANILGIENKQIEIRFGDESLFAAARVFKLKKDHPCDGGRIVDNEEYDTILIHLYDTKIKLSGDLETTMNNRLILHELAHVRFPRFNETQVADATERLIHVWEIEKLAHKRDR